jgi:Domain of unknown function (DUF1707)
VTPTGIWREFEHDPRDPAYAGMRASDRDRGVVHDVLASAYAEGRLDRDELDERTSAVTAAKTYAELLPPIRDLTAEAVPAGLAPVAPGDVRRSAEVHYAAERREALFAFLVPNLICWAIWYLTGHDYFAWPVFVSIPTALHLLRVLASRQEIVEKRVEKLQRRQAKELEAPEGTSAAAGPIVGGAEQPEPRTVRENDED